MEIKTKGEKTKERLCSDFRITLNDFDLRMSQLFSQLNITTGVLIIENAGSDIDYKCYLDGYPDDYINLRITQRGNKKDYPKFKIIKHDVEIEFTFISDSEKGTINLQNRTFYDGSGNSNICDFSLAPFYSFRQLIDGHQIEINLKINGQKEELYGDLENMQAYLTTCKLPIDIEVIAGNLCSLVSEATPIEEIIFSDKVGDNIIKSVHIKKGKVISIMTSCNNGTATIDMDETATFKSDDYSIIVKDGQAIYLGPIMLANIEGLEKMMKERYDQAIKAIGDILTLKAKLLSLKAQ